MFSSNQTRQNLAFEQDNYCAAKQHLSALAGQDDIENVPFIFAAFHDQDKAAPPWQRHCTLRNAWRYIVRMQRQGYGTFVCVNSSRNGRRTKADINRIRSVHADFDGPMLGEYALLPSLIIQTGPGKGHAYLLVDQADPIAPHVAEQINRQIAATHGADRRACDRSRVLRLAGTYHLKREPYLVRIVEANGALYGRSELLRAYPPPDPKPKPIINTGPVAHGDRYVAAAIDGERERLAKAGEGHRNHTLNRCAFSLAQLGLAITEIATVLGPVALGVGLDRSEAWATIKSGATAGARFPRQIGGAA